MPQAAQPIIERGRHATSPALRALATVVALLLTLSALGQVAHFLLVPHAICAEHGELLELSEQAAHASAGQVDHGSDSDDRFVASELGAEHDHCQVLARGQREQALPAAPSFEVAPASLEADLVVARQEAVYQALAALSLAPKTSPPHAALG
jgi:hypothetical protein